jgi:NAD(P)-dependent dehydrogenase (short-subunit alcohol dehydrogenase family)
MGVLDGRVVLVTGAAGGIGKACALLAGTEGATVVANDIGASVRGDEPGSSALAEATAAEIRTQGGKAVASGDNITDKAAVEALIQRTIAEFGDLHAVINPAGILRDAMFHKMADSDWDSVIEVHLRGAYNVTRATIEYFRRKKDGAYVHFTSTTGLIGNIGQANYGAAKLGVVGLSRIVALENAQHNVRSNIIAPFAWTRMIATIPVKDEASAQRVERLRTGMKAEQVAQLAVTLASTEASNVTGQIFAARGNEVILFSQPRPVRSMANPQGWTPRSLLDTALPAMRNSFTDLGVSASVFPYDPV